MIWKCALLSSVLISTLSLAQTNRTTTHTTSSTNTHTPTTNPNTPYNPNTYNNNPNNWSNPNQNELNSKKTACQELVTDCKSAGFMEGDKEGKDLWKDCVCQLYNGNTQNMGALKLPSVSTKTISDCITANPHFCDGR